MNRHLLWPWWTLGLSLGLFSGLQERALYELGYELNRRPTWVKVPL